MSDPVLLIEQLASARDLPLPRYMSDQAAGMDLCAAVEGDLPAGRQPGVVLGPGEQAVVPTGIRVAIPAGYEGQVRPRSGLAAKHGVTVLNTVGTVDADYRGEVRVILINHGTEPFTIRRGDRIAQLVIAPVTRVTVKQVDRLDDTSRGAGGFGHTGQGGGAPGSAGVPPARPADRG